VIYGEMDMRPSLNGSCDQVVPARCLLVDGGSGRAFFGVLVISSLSHEPFSQGDIGEPDSPGPDRGKRGAIVEREGAARSARAY